MDINRYFLECPEYEQYLALMDIDGSYNDFIP